MTLWQLFSVYEQDPFFFFYSCLISGGIFPDMIFWLKFPFKGFFGLSKGRTCPYSLEDTKAGCLHSCTEWNEEFRCQLEMQFQKHIPASIIHLAIGSPTWSEGFTVINIWVFALEISSAEICSVVSQGSSRNHTYVGKRALHLLGAPEMPVDGYERWDSPPSSAQFFFCASGKIPFAIGSRDSCHSKCSLVEVAVNMPANSWF